jgi:hypothetical protein
MNATSNTPFAFPAQYETRLNMNGLYKLLSHLITLWDDIENRNPD